MFDIKYLYATNEADIGGKKVILSDTVGDIEASVNSGVYALHECNVDKVGNPPFFSPDTNLHYRYAYYDPNLVKENYKGIAEKIDKMLGGIEYIQDVENVLTELFLKRPDTFKNWIESTLGNLDFDELQTVIKNIRSCFGPAFDELLAGIGYVDTDNEAILESAIDDNHALKQRISQGYINDLSTTEKADYIKDWIQDVL